MTSTIHHPVPIQSRGLIICEMDEETTEPKTILEIGGVSRPRPTYMVPSQRAHALAPPPNNPVYLNHWKAEKAELVSPQFPAFSEYQEQKILRIPNSNWISGPEKLPMTTSMPKGNFDKTHHFCSFAKR